jgi:hypothetical protein
MDFSMVVRVWHTALLAAKWYVHSFGIRGRSQRRQTRNKSMLYCRLFSFLENTFSAEAGANLRTGELAVMSRSCETCVTRTFVRRKAHVLREKRPMFVSDAGWRTVVGGPKNRTLSNPRDPKFVPRSLAGFMPYSSGRV